MDQLDANVMRTILRIVPIALVGAAIAASAGWPSVAAAHAFPSAETPKVGSTVDTPPHDVEIQFDNPIEALFARLQVTDGAGNDVTASPPALGADRRELSVRVKPLAPGDYNVKWSVVAEDGHRTEGSYSFTIAANAR